MQRATKKQAKSSEYVRTYQQARLFIARRAKAQWVKKKYLHPEADTISTLVMVHSHAKQNFKKLVDHARKGHDHIVNEFIARIPAKK